MKRSFFNRVDCISLRWHLVKITVPPPVALKWVGAFSLCKISCALYLIWLHIGIGVVRDVVHCGSGTYQMLPCSPMPIAHSPYVQGQMVQLHQIIRVVFHHPPTSPTCTIRTIMCVYVCVWRAFFATILLFSFRNNPDREDGRTNGLLLIVVAIGVAAIIISLSIYSCRIVESKDSKKIA